MSVWTELADRPLPRWQGYYQAYHYDPDPEWPGGPDFEVFGTHSQSGIIR